MVHPWSDRVMGRWSVCVMGRWSDREMNSVYEYDPGGGAVAPGWSNRGQTHDPSRWGRL
jgi:hypothetical protein